MGEFADFAERCPLVVFGAFIILLALANAVGQIGRCRCKCGKGDSRG